MQNFYKELLNDANPADLRANQRLGYEGEAVWVDYLRSQHFNANRAPGHVSANGPDVFASRFHDGRLQIIVGEVKATRNSMGGIGKLRWNVQNRIRQMSYSWIDKYATEVVEGIIQLGISGIGSKQLEILLDRGEVDLYLLGALKDKNTWSLKGVQAPPCWPRGPRVRQ